MLVIIKKSPTTDFVLHESKFSFKIFDLLQG